MPDLPRHPYLVCATQRSGSTLLCETLRSLGTAGTPLEHFQVKRDTGRPPQPREYFAGLDDPEVLAHLAPTAEPDPSPLGSAEWWAGVLEEGSTPDGVWGGKLMWDQVPDLTEHFRAILGRPDATLRDGIDELLGPTHLVYVTRGDKVAQAVSLWKAVQTQEWRDGGGQGDKRDPEYSFAGIDHLVGWLTKADDGWRTWFADQDIDPLTVAYEDLAGDVPGQVRRVLRHLELPADDVPEPPLRRQADDRSREWAERYRHEAGVAA